MSSQLRGNPAENENLFGAGSVLRRVSSEASGLLGGGRAILMQLAHPLVAAGVADHSNFSEDPMARLHRTLDLMMAVVLGNRQDVQAALRRFEIAHSSIRGHLQKNSGYFTVGTNYTADDPPLKLWVHATLVDTSIITYERFNRTLTSKERSLFYKDTRLLGQLMGIPTDLLPQRIEDFDHYVKAMLEGQTLAVTDITHRLARQVLKPNVGVVPRACMQLIRFTTTGLLPERLREAYGFEWSWAQQETLDGMSWVIRLLRPIMPSSICLMPQAGGGKLVHWVIQTTRLGRSKRLRRRNTQHRV